MTFVESIIKTFSEKLPNAKLLSLKLGNPEYYVHGYYNHGYNRLDMSQFPLHYRGLSYGNLKLRSISGKFDASINPCVLVKCNTKLFITIGTVHQCIEVRKCVIRYMENKILYRDDRVMMFSSISSFEFEDMTFLEADDPIYSAFESIYNDIYHKKKIVSIMILNAKFESIEIFHKGTGNFPSSNCKNLTISVHMNPKGWKHFKKYEKLPEDCKLIESFYDIKHNDDPYFAYISKLSNDIDITLKICLSYKIKLQTLSLISLLIDNKNVTKVFFEGDRYTMKEFTIDYASFWRKLITLPTLKEFKFNVALYKMQYVARMLSSENTFEVNSFYEDINVQNLNPRNLEIGYGNNEFLNNIEIN